MHSHQKTDNIVKTYEKRKQKKKINYSRDVYYQLICIGYAAMNKI